MRLDRTNTTLIGRWWWTVDRLTLGALVILIAIGAILVTAASPPVAVRIGLDPFYFITRQHLFLLLCLLVMVGVSFLPVHYVRRVAFMGVAISLLCMVTLPFIGIEVKGAKRWLSLLGMSVQPSEFLKPCLAVAMAWIFSLRTQRSDFPSYSVAVGLYLLVVALLLIQPDLGMVIVISSVWMMQFFLAGLPFVLVFALAGMGIAGLFGAYHFFPHVRKRIDNFMDPTSGDNYQVAKSLEAFANGGILGRGPGEGQVKQFIPDSHTDFIFAVAGEEFGVIACLIILGLYAFIVLRGLGKLWKENDPFILIAVAGLLAQFGFQAMVNMGVSVNLLPAKGMTLPFLSYGGSSLIAIALGMGMMLALTRRRYNSENAPVTRGGIMSRKMQRGR